jgi:hypothetical protein
MANTKIILEIFLVAFFIQSCQYFTQTETQYIKIDIYITKPACTENFPSDLKLIATPFTIDQCENVGFIPKVTIHRMDFNSEDSILIEPSMTRGKIFHQKSPYGQEAQEVNQFLAEMACDKILSKASDKKVSLSEPQGNQNDVFLKYDPSVDTDKAIYSKIDSLIGRIKREIYSERKVSEKHFIIYYKVSEQPIRKEDDKINGIIASADSAMSAGDYDKAVGLYEQAAKLDSTNQKVRERIIIIRQTIYQTIATPSTPSKPEKPDTVVKKQNIPVEYVPFYGLSIEEKLTKIADEKNSLKKRRIYKDITLEDFTNSDALVYIVSSDSSKIINKQSIFKYLNNLYETHNYKINVVEKTIGDNGKISSIHISESYR